MNSTTMFSGYKTRQQLAAEYEISTKTLRSKLKAKDIDLPSGRVSLAFQKKVYEALGYPLCVSKKDYNRI